MMEAIGQKTPLTNPDEIIVTDEMGVDSGEIGDEKIFDDTLEEIIAEEPLDESQLEEPLDGENFTSSLYSIKSTQDQTDPEIVVGNFGTEELLNFPTIVSDDTLLIEESRSVPAQVLRKSEQITQELIEVLDPRVSPEGNIYQNLPVQGIAETGLQSILQESDLEDQESLLQTVFHQEKPQEEGSEFSIIDSKTVLQNNRDLAGQLEDNSEFSMRQTVFHQVDPPEKVSDDDIQTVLQTNTSQTVPIKEIHSGEQDLKPVQGNRNGLVQNEIQTVLPQELKGNEREDAKPVAETLLKNLPAEVKGDTKVAHLAEVVPTTEVVPATGVVPKVEVVTAPKVWGDAEVADSEKTSKGNNPQVAEENIAENSLTNTGNFETEEFEVKVDSKTKAGLQVIDVKNLNENSEMVSRIPTEKIKAAESLKVVEGIKTSEDFQAKSPELLKDEGKVKDSADLKMINVENLRKSDEKVSTMPAEKIHAVQNLRIADGIRTSEEIQGKPNELLESRIQEKATSDLKMIDVENLKKSDEKVSILPAEKLKSAESLKVVYNINKKEDFQAKPAEILESRVKGKAPVAFQMNDLENSKNVSENSSKQPLNQLNGVENTKDLFEKSSKQPLNPFSSISSKETQIHSNAKSTVDSVPSLGINPVSDTSGTSILRGTDVANSTSETLRNVDLPFNMEQVVSRVRILSGNGIEEMTLRLHPEELGQISLKIRQSGGNLSIDMRVDNMFAKQIVESGFDSLRSRFLDQEFSYQDLALNVDINERDSKYGGDRKDAEFDEDIFSSEKVNKKDISVMEETPLIRHRTDTGLNLYV